jgi:hypothetical protein
VSDATMYTCTYFSFILTFTFLITFLH